MTPRVTSDTVAKAVQNAANAARRSGVAAPNSPHDEARTVTATIIDEGLGGPPDALRRMIHAVEVAGDVYRREANQDLAHAQVAKAQRWARLKELLADRPEAWSFIQECLADEALVILREFDAHMRATGELLVTNGYADLWRLIYLRWREGDLYVLDDEIRFLRKEPPACPEPVPEV